MSEWLFSKVGTTTGYVSSKYLSETKDSSNSSSDNTSNSTTSASKVVSYAKSFLGKPYVWGAQGPSSFDCSGFTYYVFKNKDIEFVDENIVIPYLYNSLNEEDIAYKRLEETIENLFEFKSEKLKNKMLQEISKIRNEFPLWEYRGFTKMEVNK